MKKLLARVERTNGFDKVMLIIVGMGLPIFASSILLYNLKSISISELTVLGFVFITLLVILVLTIAIFGFLAVLRELLYLKMCKKLLKQGVLIKGLKYTIERVKKDYKKAYNYILKARYISDDGKEYTLKQLNENPISVYCLYDTMDAVIDPGNMKNFYLNVAMEKAEYISKIDLDFTRDIVFSGVIDKNYDHIELNNKFIEYIQIKDIDELKLYSNTFSTSEISNDFWTIDDYINNPIFIKYSTIDYTINYFMKIEENIYFGSIAPIEYRTNGETPIHYEDEYILKFNFNHSLNTSFIIEGKKKKSKKFDECYSVFSNDEEKVKEILNEERIEKLIAIKHKIKGYVDFCIHKDKAYVFFQEIPTLTELQGGNKNQKTERDLCSTFDGILDCIEFLKELGKND